MKKYIPLEECENGYIYRIASRNLAFGVFDEENKSFHGLRTKFDDIFIAQEWHWDTGAPYGTAKPLEKTEYYFTFNIKDEKELKLKLFEIEYKTLQKENLKLERKVYKLNEEKNNND